jgi:hypothetical protein
MLVGWQTIGGKTYYFRSSGAMQTGKATIDGKAYEFTSSGTLKSGNPPALAAQEEGDTGPDAEDEDAATEVQKSDAGEEASVVVDGLLDSGAEGRRAESNKAADSLGGDAMELG